MTGFRLLPVLFMLGCAMTAPAGADPSIMGRWAVNPDECSGYLLSMKGPLSVGDYAVRWRGESCRIVRMYKTGDTVHDQAMCWDPAGERSIPISMRPKADRLEVRWNREKAANLKRCQ